MVELADTLDLGSGAYPQNLIGLSGYGGIGRRVRFRFLCHMACGFKSHWPHKIRLFAKWIILQGALFFCAVLEFWSPNGRHLATMLHLKTFIFCSTQNAKQYTKFII